jgi:hypothetical protein
LLAKVAALEDRAAKAVWSGEVKVVRNAVLSSVRIKGFGFVGVEVLQLLWLLSTASPTVTGIPGGVVTVARRGEEELSKGRAKLEVGSRCRRGKLSGVRAVEVPR